jgi:mycolipenoyl-CoA---2-(long-chain-fatty acyl)-trehalose mycolipenoyltransferase / long-chain-acyl-CoA---trehalose acyltransferase
MKPLSFDVFRTDAGTVTEFAITADTAAAAAAAPADPTPLSYNQLVHVHTAIAQAALGTPSAPYIGLTFDVPGAVDLEALRRAFTGLIHRHDALRSGFRTNGLDVERFTLPTEQVALEVGSPVEFTDIEALHDHLGTRFVASTNPLNWPQYVMGVVARPTRSTIFFATDHTTSDGYSLSVAQWELQARYEAELAGTTVELPPVGSYADYATTERARGELIAPDEEIVQRWREFVRHCGGTGPTFAVDLGVEIGTTYQQVIHERQLLNAEDAAKFEKLVKSSGGGFFSGLLAAMAIVTQELTGNTEFRSVTPFHTRHDASWMAALGWFITVAPLEFSLQGALSFSEVLRTAHAAFRASIPAAQYPAARVVQLLADEFTPTRRDLFSMVSYIDYRKMPGAERYSENNALTIGANTEATDDTHVWVSRTTDGLFITLRHPETATSDKLVTEYTTLISALVSEVANYGDVLLAPQSELVGAV